MEGYSTCYQEWGAGRFGSRPRGCTGWELSGFIVAGEEIGAPFSSGSATFQAFADAPTTGASSSGSVTPPAPSANTTPGTPSSAAAAHAPIQVNQTSSAPSPSTPTLSPNSATSSDTVVPAPAPLPSISYSACTDQTCDAIDAASYRVCQSNADSADAPKNCVALDAVSAERLADGQAVLYKCNSDGACAANAASTLRVCRITDEDRCSVYKLGAVSNALQAEAAVSA